MRSLRRRALPAGVVLGPDEHVVARATTADGGELIATSHGLWLPGAERLGWHLVGRVTWDAGTLVLFATRETGEMNGAVLLADEPPRRVRLADPGRVPEAVHKRVTESIRSRHRRDLPGGGAWFVQRSVPGRDGVVLQVRPDPGTDEAAVRQVVAAVATAMRRS